MALDFIRKEHYNTEDLIRIVALLRAPGGCPWDQAQTHASIKKNFIEETYEVIEAINRQSTAGLQEELGDVLLQVALHAQMEAEAGRFDFNDVADGICKKLIFRHPHVFGDVKAENTDDALDSWDAAKLKEKGLTLVPIKVYFKDSLVKIEIGMARGKKLYDKRQDIAKKDQRREAERDFKVKNLY